MAGTSVDAAGKPTETLLQYEFLSYDRPWKAHWAQWVLSGPATVRRACDWLRGAASGFRMLSCPGGAALAPSRYISAFSALRQHR